MRDSRWVLDLRGATQAALGFSKGWAATLSRGTAWSAQPSSTWRAGTRATLWTLRQTEPPLRVV